MADATPKSYHTDPQLYLYTSLTSGSSQIVTATSRLQTILKANKIQFQALDVATDEKARMLWGRRAGKRKLPGLVRYGMIIGDLEQIEEWNEYGELKENVAETKPAAKATPSTSAVQTPTKPPPAPAAPPTSTISASSDTAPAESKKVDDVEAEKAPAEAPKADPQQSLAAAMRNIGFEAAKQAGDKKAQARKDVLEAAKAKDDDLKKLDNSTAEGLPPPTGTTEAAEAQKPETGESTAASKSDDAPAISDSKVAAETGLDGASEKAKDKSPEAGSSGTAEASETQVPTSHEAQKKANEAIADNEEAVLEGIGQADPEEVKIPTAKEIEALANKAIVEDKHSHVQIVGGGSVPSPLSPPPKKQEKPDDIPEAALQQDEKTAEETTTEIEDADEKDQSVTAQRQEAKVGVAPPIEADSSNAEDLKPASRHEEREDGSTGVIPLTTEEHAVEKPAEGITESKAAAGPKDGVLPLTDTTAASTSGAATTHAHDQEAESEADSPESKEPAAAATGIPQALPGSNIQSQPAADGEKVGESVED